MPMRHRQRPQHAAIGDIDQRPVVRFEGDPRVEAQRVLVVDRRPVAAARHDAAAQPFPLDFAAGQRGDHAAAEMRGPDLLLRFGESGAIGAEVAEFGLVHHQSFR